MNACPCPDCDLLQQRRKDAGRSAWTILELYHAAAHRFGFVESTSSRWGVWLLRRTMKRWTGS